MLIDAGDFQRTGIRDQTMPAAACQADRPVGANFIEVLPDRGALIFWEIILIPPASLNPAIRCRVHNADILRERILKVGDRTDSLKAAPGEPCTESQQVHMGVVKTRCYKLAMQVTEDVIGSGISEEVLRASDLGENPIMDSESVRRRICAEQIGMIIDCFHIEQSLHRLFSHCTLPTFSCQGTGHSACAPIFAMVGGVPTASFVMVTVFANAPDRLCEIKTAL